MEVDHRGYSEVHTVVLMILDAPAYLGLKDVHSGYNLVKPSTAESLDSYITRNIHSFTRGN